MGNSITTQQAKQGEQSQQHKVLSKGAKLLKVFYLLTSSQCLLTGPSYEKNPSRQLLPKIPPTQQRKLFKTCLILGSQVSQKVCFNTHINFIFSPTSYLFVKGVNISGGLSESETVIDLVKQ